MSRIPRDDKPTRRVTTIVSQASIRHDPIWSAPPPARTLVEYASVWGRPEAAADDLARHIPPADATGRGTQPGQPCHPRRGTAAARTPSRHVRRESIMSGSTAETEIFEQHRRHLTGVAYRITGSWTDAEDIAQDVWLRWANAHRDVDRPHNWLLRVTVRVSLDRLRRLKRRRETYVGPWLPEPLSLAPDPEDTAELRDTLMVGMLLVLESLSPLERAVFVLRDAFAWDYEDIAEALGRSPAAVRQLARRAHHHVEQARPRFAVDERRAAESTERFLRACLDGKVDDLLRVLSPDVVMYTDGGGEAPAPKRALVGTREVLSFLAGLGRKNAFARRKVQARPCQYASRHHHQHRRPGAVGHDIRP
jgi:RNA polymerase sigma factor (sigma-70 family)